MTSTRKPWRPFFHLHRPRLHVERTSGDQRLPQRFHVFGTHVIHIGREQHHPARRSAAASATRIRNAFG